MPNPTFCRYRKLIYYSLRFPTDFTLPESCLRLWLQPYIYLVFLVLILLRLLSFYQNTNIIRCLDFLLCEDFKSKLSSLPDAPRRCSNPIASTSSRRGSYAQNDKISFKFYYFKSIVKLKTFLSLTSF